VEPDPLGSIALADLITFVVSFSDSAGFGIGGETLRSGLNLLTSFNFETLGGAGTLSFGELGSASQGSACVGFLSLLSDLDCSRLTSAFPGANAFVVNALTPYASTLALPAVTRVSSVTTPAPVPEPSSWALFGIGFASIVFLRRLKARTEANVHSRREAMACSNSRGSYVLRSAVAMRNRM
jgi:hypothetical protein